MFTGKGTAKESLLLQRGWVEAGLSKRGLCRKRFVRDQRDMWKMNLGFPEEQNFGGKKERFKSTFKIKFYYKNV